MDSPILVAKFKDFIYFCNCYEKWEDTYTAAVSIALHLLPL